VWYERKGTCSSKHAFLKHVADLNDIQHVELILCMYRMNAINTQKVGEVLTEFQIDYLPEAHCYLRIKGESVDVTSTHSNFSLIEKDVLEEQIIQPEQVAEFKVDYHQSFMKKWGEQYHPEMTFEELWAIREQCIARLEK
jgi:hypothetical protein